MDRSAGITLIIIGVAVTIAGGGMYYASMPPPGFSDMPMPNCLCGIGPLTIITGGVVLAVADRQARRKAGQGPSAKSQEDQP